MHIAQQQQTNTHRIKSRPLGVTVLALVVEVGGLASAGIYLWHTQPLAAGVPASVVNPLLALGVVGTTLLALGLTWALWTQQPWARNALIGLESLYFLFGLLVYHISNLLALSLFSMVFVVTLMALYVIYHRDVQQVFGKL